MQTVLLGILLVNICLVIQVTGFIDFIPIPDEDVEYCTPDKKASHVDVSEFHLITVKDRNFVNGSVKFLKDIKAPWKMDVTTERLVNGKWQDGTFKKQYRDFCAEKNNLFGSMARMSRDLGNCPIKAGSILRYNMVPISPTPILLPETFRGQWRVHTRTMYGDSNGKVADCLVILAEVLQK